VKTFGPLSGSVTVGRPWHRRTAEAASRLARAAAPAAWPTGPRSGRRGDHTAELGPGQVAAGQL